MRVHLLVSESRACTAVEQADLCLVIRKASKGRRIARVQTTSGGGGLRELEQCTGGSKRRVHDEVVGVRVVGRAEQDAGWDGRGAATGRGRSGHDVCVAGNRL